MTDVSVPVTALPEPPPVPLVARLGLDVRRAGDGVAVSGEFGPRWAGADAAGVAALLCDAATGSAVALIDPRRAISTALLSIDVLGPPPRSGLVTALSANVARRGDYVYVTASVRDSAGAEFARARSWWAIRGERNYRLPPEEPAGSRAVPEALPSTDPTGTAIGRELELTGWARTPDTVSFELPKVGTLSNRSGTLHGGVGALLAQMAAVSAVGPGTQTPEVLSMTCHYLRAAGSGGGPVRVTGSPVRAGRTSAVARGEVAAHDGRPALVATVTMAFPGAGS